MRPSILLTEDTILLPLSATDREQAITELLGKLKQLKYISDIEPAKMNVEENEKLLCTAAGRGVAYPHGESGEISELVAILGISKKGLNYHSPDGQLCHLVVLTLSSQPKPNKHRKFLKQIRLMMSTPQVRAKLIEAPNVKTVVDLIAEWEKSEFDDESITKY